MKFYSHTLKIIYVYFNLKYNNYMAFATFMQRNGTSREWYLKKEYGTSTKEELGILSSHPGLDLYE